jgi:hypothetical protein
VRIYRWAALALLTACASKPQDPDDPVRVLWKRVDDAQVACQKVAGHKEIVTIHGCSKRETARSGERLCTIYAPAPDTESDTQAFATLGHELMHCFKGNWHDRWGRMHPSEGEAAAGGTKKAN